MDYNETKKYYPGIFLEKLKKTKKNLRIAGVQTEVRSEGLQNRSQKPYSYTFLVAVI
jgi:hypothetical protein